MIKLQSNKNLIAKTADINVLILKVTENPSLPRVLRDDKALIVDEITSSVPEGFGCVLVRSTDDKLARLDPRVSVLSKDLYYLAEGDVIRVILSTNFVRVLYRRAANANFLLTTERCNSFCLMCSQPPRDVDDAHLAEELLRAIPLIDRSAPEIGLTGGEPLLLGEHFFSIIRSLKSNLPETAVHILSNGRLFSDEMLARRLSSVAHPDLMLGIPLYSDLASIHDFVVQADGAFDETIRGVLNLKRYKQKVEIRIVVHNQTHRRLPQLAEFIGRNLQFVDHVAIMGLEITGFTRANLDELWIDPVEYQNHLIEAVEILSSLKVKVSLYNMQRCLLPRQLWEYSVKSISDWKNKYYDECEKCVEMDRCGGFFASSDLKRSEHIRAIVR